MTRTVVVMVLGLVGASMGNACAGLNPHTTIAGRAFPAERMADVHEQQTPDEVRAILGDPFEERRAGAETLWRYFQEAYPRGCRTYVGGIPLSQLHTVAVEALITFRDGKVVRVELRRQGPDDWVLRPASQNKALKLTARRFDRGAAAAGLSWSVRCTSP